MKTLNLQDGKRLIILEIFFRRSQTVANRLMLARDSLIKPLPSTNRGSLPAALLLCSELAELQELREPPPLSS